MTVNHKISLDREANIDILPVCTTNLLATKIITNSQYVTMIEHTNKGNLINRENNNVHEEGLVKMKEVMRKKMMTVKVLIVNGMMKEFMATNKKITILKRKMISIKIMTVINKAIIIIITYRDLTQINVNEIII